MLSGALFPIDNAPLWLEVLIKVNPVSHALVILRQPFYLSPEQLFARSDYLIGLVVTFAWAAGCLLWSMKRVERREQGVPVV